MTLLHHPRARGASPGLGPLGNTTFGDTVAEAVQDLVSGGKWPGLTGSLCKDEKMSSSSDMYHVFLISPPALMRSGQEGGTGGAETPMLLLGNLLYALVGRSGDSSLYRS